MNILAFFLCLEPILSQTSINHLAIIAEAIFTMTGRVTRLGISRHTNHGGSYRAVQPSRYESWFAPLRLVFRAAQAVALRHSIAMLYFKQLA